VGSFRGRVQHTNLRLVDRIRAVGYAEDTVQWTTDTAEETDSISDSESGASPGICEKWAVPPVPFLSLSSLSLSVPSPSLRVNTWLISDNLCRSPTAQLRAEVGHLALDRLQRETA